VIGSNRIKHIIAIIKRHMMALGRSRSVTFDDERNNESDHMYAMIILESHQMMTRRRMLALIMKTFLSLHSC
jgi:hypothetical protein